MNKPKLKVVVAPNKLTLIRPEGCVRILIGYYQTGDKYFLYLGFDRKEDALRLREYLIEKGLCAPYNYKKDAGMNLPRPAKYVGQKWEIKVHRPTMELVEMFVRKERANNQKAA